MATGGRRRPVTLSLPRPDDVIAVTVVAKDNDGHVGIDFVDFAVAVASSHGGEVTSSGAPAPWRLRVPHQGTNDLGLRRR